MIFVPLHTEIVINYSPPQSMNDIAIELAKLHILNGADFIRQLKLIVSLPDFHLVEESIYAMGGEQSEDYENLLNAARKAVEHGNTVYILPNPKGIRTADFIFENKGVYKMYDLKTIHGKSSVINRLLESIGQANHILLNMTTDYNARLLASDIKMYFEMNKEAIEVLVYKSNKIITIKRGLVINPTFNRIFRKLYEK